MVGDDGRVVDLALGEATLGAEDERARAAQQGDVQDRGPFGGGALDRLVHQAVQVQLKGWLDENLETHVEWVVRKEVRRLAHRAEKQ